MRAKFCGECGGPLPAGAKGGLVQELAERKFLTILFADIRNSTRMIQDLDPEDAMAKLRPALEVMMAAVREAGGMVNRVHGDGIMALFGAPVAVDDHPLRGCRAALLMRSRIAELDDSDISVRIGVHSGEVVAHIDTGDFAQAYDVTGPAAHFAARLEQAAEADTAFISEETWKLVRGSIEARPRAGLSFKGFDHAVDAWELTGFGQRSRWAARQASGLSPFVGREATLATLRARLEEAHGGRLQLVSVGGEAGIGKSRLVHELIGGQPAGHWTVWDADGETTSSRSSYAILRQLLRRWLGVDDAAPHEQVVETLRAQLERSPLTVPSSGSSALAALLNLPVADAAWADMDLSARARLIEAAVFAVLSSAQRAGPIILLIEDYHWADAESRELLLKLPTHLPKARIALVLTHRPMEGLPEPGDHVVRAQLAEFTPEMADFFLDQLLGSHPSLAGIKHGLRETAGALPFFLEESARHLLDTGALSGTIGNCIAADPTLPLATPRTAQAVAAARVDALEQPLRALVRAAAAIGRRFPRALLGDIMRLDFAAVAAAVRELTQRHIFFDGTDPLADTVEFRHDFIREAAYGALLRSRRQELHRDIVGAIEGRFANQLPDWTAALAHHATQAQWWEKAIDYERKTADLAIEASSYPAALAAYQRALGCLQKLPRTRDAIVQAIDIRLALRVAIAASSDIAQWIRYVDEAAALAAEIGDPSRRLQASIHRAWALNFAAYPHDAKKEILVAIGIAQAAGRAGDPMLAMGRFVLGQAHYAAGEYSEALDALGLAVSWLSQGREELRIGSTGTLSVACHVMKATALASLGRFADAESSLKDASRICALTTRTYDFALSRYGVGFLKTASGKPAESVPELRLALGYCETGGIGNLMPLILTHLGAALLLTGRHEEARATLENAIAAARSAGHEIAAIAAQIFLSGSILASGDVSKARALAEAAYGLARERALNGIWISACRVLAVCHSTPDAFAPDKALALYEEAESKAETIGARPMLMACIAGQAKLHHQLGNARMAESLNERLRQLSS